MLSETTLAHLTLKYRPDAKQHVWLPLVTITLLISICSQAQSSPSTSSSTVPEDGFVSSEKYTNAFFGFALTIPKLPNAQPFMPKTRNGSHTLFGVQAYGRGLSALLVIAKESASGSAEDVKKAAAGAAARTAKPITIAAKPFWKSEVEQKSSAGRMTSVTYATALQGYILTFAIVSFDASFAREWEHSIESLTFFNPATAKDVAGPNSRPLMAEFVPSKRIGTLSLGIVSGNVYANDDLGFTYEFPKDWHVVDKATEEKLIEAGHQAAWGDDPAARREHEQAQQCGRLLLAASKYPEGSTAATSNPAISITTFDAECLPGAPRFPTSADDDEGISRVGGAVLQSLKGTPFKPTKQSSVRVLTVQGHLMIEIPGEYSVKMPGEQLALRNSASVVLTELKNYWVVFTFQAATEAGVQDIMQNAKIRFAPSPSSPVVGR